MEKRKISGWVFLTTGILMILSFILGYFVNCFSVSDSAKKLDEVLELIDGNSIYYDGENTGLIIKSVVGNVLTEDNYAKYYTKDEKAVQDTQDNGVYGGTGLIFFTDKDGKVKGEYNIHKIINNSPLDKAGVKAKDVIKAVKIDDGEFKQFSDNNELLSYLSKIDKESNITFKIDRDGEFTDKEFTVKKQNYTASMVTYYDDEFKGAFLYETSEPVMTKLEGMGNNKLPSDTAYIVFDEFSGNAVEEFAGVFAFFNQRGKTKLILDLRDNGGGFMNILLDVASYFINSEQSKNTIVHVRENKREYDYTTKKKNYPNKLVKTVVLANGNTASASECLIGAMIHYGTIGYEHLILTEYNEERENYSTFGKGIMQQTFDLKDGDALKLTTAMIYWPDKTTTIHGKGIVQENAENCTSDVNAINRAIEILK